MKLFTMDADKKTGSVLLLCLGVLALLSMLGTALIFMVGSEKRELKSWVDSTRAQVASESGVDAALAKITSYNDNWLNIPEFIAANPRTPTTPLEYLIDASFGEKDLDGDGGREVSGIISQTYRADGDLYKLRVRDSQGLLNINDTNSPWNVDTDAYADQRWPELDYEAYPAHYKEPGGKKDPDWVYATDPAFDVSRSFNNLSYPKAEGRLHAITRELVSLLFPSHVNPNLGAEVADAIFKARRNIPGEAFDSFALLRELLVPKFFTQEEYRLFESQLTLHSWQDDKVLRPTFQWQISRPEQNPSHNIGDMKICVLLEGMAPNAGSAIDRPLFGSIYNRRLPPFPAGTTLEYLPNDMVKITAVNGVESIVPLSSIDMDVINYNTRRPDWTRSNDSNIYDVYLFSDAQTKYHETESRSPINVNSASKEMLAALIRPLSGWWLRETPELDRPDFDPVKDLTAEDWSVPVSLGRPLAASHPWYCGQAGLIATDASSWQSLLGGMYFSDGYYLPDESSYYYYDEQQCAVADIFEPARQGEGRLYYAAKHKRFGRLDKIIMTQALADAVAENIHARVHGVGYAPFSTWEEFEYYLRDLSMDDSAFLGIADPNFIPGMKPEMADLLIANFNPNSRINGFNSNKEHHLLTDKSKLIQNSAELCFQSFGWFDISSLGEVHDGSGAITGRRQTRALVNPGFQTLRISSQADFMRGYSPQSNVAQSAHYLGKSLGVTKTSGLNFINGNPDDTFGGCALQSYPEPECRGGENWIENSRFDGYIALATMNPPVSEAFADLGASFYAAMNGSLQALDTGIGDGNIYVDAGTETWIPDAWKKSQRYYYELGRAEYLNADNNAPVPANRPHSGRLTLPWADASSMKLPGNLYPDGAFSDAGRALKYNAGNIGNPATNGLTGSAQFWVKPGFDPAHANRIREFFSMAQQDVARSTLAAPQLFTFTDGTPQVTLPKGTFMLSYRGDVAGYRGRAMEIPTSDFSIYYFSHGGARIPSSQTDTIPIYDVDMMEDWIPTRSLFVQARLQTTTASQPSKTFSTRQSSTTANHSWGGTLPASDLYHLEARQWTLMSWAWDFRPGLPLATQRVLFSVNGKPIEAREQQAMVGALAFQNLHRLADGSPNFVRFGESSSSPFRNNVADSTFDGLLSNAGIFALPELMDEFTYGRYSPEATAAYTSPEYDLLEIFGKESGSFKLQNVSWTLYWPRVPRPGFPPSDPRFNGNREVVNSDRFAPMRATLHSDLFPKDPMADVWGEDWAPISLNILKPNGQWCYGDLSLSAREMPNFAGGSKDRVWDSLRWKTGNAFRFRAHFNIDESQVLFSTPIFDDISFLFLSGKSRVQLWEAEDLR